MLSNLGHLVLSIAHGPLVRLPLVNIESSSPPMPLLAVLSPEVFTSYETVKE